MVRHRQERVQVEGARAAAAGKLGAGNANSLAAKLRAAAASFDRGNATPGVNQLESVQHELDALTMTGRLAAADAEPLRAYVARLIRSATR